MMKQKLLVLFFIVLCFPNIIYSNINTLFQAVVQKNKTALEYMIKNRVDLNASDSRGMTALHYVTDPLIAINLIKNGANVNAINKDGTTPLHFAVSRNNETIAELLLQFGADVNTPDANGNTPLHFAVKNPKKEIMIVLLTNNANVNISNKAGITPLMDSLVQNNNVDIKYLLFADIEQLKTQIEKSPTALEIVEFGVPVIETNIFYTEDPLIQEIFLENYNTAVDLINKGMSLDGTDINGNTPLHWIFMKKNRYLSRLLLSKNIDYEATNYQNYTPIDILLNTKDNNFIEYIQKLLEDKTNFMKTEN